MKQRIIVELEADTAEQAIEKMNDILKFSEYGTLVMMKKDINNGISKSGAVSDRVRKTTEAIKTTKVIRGDQYEF